MSEDLEKLTRERVEKYLDKELKDKKLTIKKDLREEFVKAVLEHKVYKKENIFILPKPIYSIFHSSHLYTTTFIPNITTSSNIVVIVLFIRLIISNTSKRNPLPKPSEHVARRFLDLTAHPAT